MKQKESDKLEPHEAWKVFKALADKQKQSRLNNKAKRRAK